MTQFGSVESNTYDAEGYRVSKTTSAGTTYFLDVDGFPIFETNASGSVTCDQALRIEPFPGVRN
jgi:YD repeat-containing protein